MFDSVNIAPPLSVNDQDKPVTVNVRDHGTPKELNLRHLIIESVLLNFVLPYVFNNGITIH